MEREFKENVGKKWEKIERRGNNMERENRVRNVAEKMKGENKKESDFKS